MTRVISRPLKCLDGATSTGRGKAFGCQGMTEFAATISGIVAGDTVSFEASQDGVDWVEVVAAAGDNGAVALPSGYNYLAPNVAAIAGGGPIDCWIGGN